MIPALLALLGGCAQEGELVCRPGYVAVDGECIEPRPETCNDGKDNDADGLLDCEDDDCLGSQYCAESSCVDGLDDDGDGLMDCTDGDCWSDPACTVVVQLDGSAGGRRLAEVTSADRFGVGAGCDATWIESSYSLVGVQSPTGELRISGGGGPATTCTFSLQSSFVRLAHADGPDAYFEQAWPVERAGFAIDPDCPVKSSGFLPDSWFLDIGSSGFALKAGDTRQDPLWFRMDPDAQGLRTTWQASSASYAGDCSTRFIHNYSSVTGLPAQPGSEFHPGSP